MEIKVLATRFRSKDRIPLTTSLKRYDAIRDSKKETLEKALIR